MEFFAKTGFNGNSPPKNGIQIDDQGTRNGNVYF